MTPARQAELIAKHGAFYLALYTGERSPRSPEQQRFVKNVRSGQSTDEHELAFLNWLTHNPRFKNKEAVDEHPTTDQNSFNCLRKNTPLSTADLLFCKELYDGFRIPETAEQDSFARNVQKGVATNDHERAFLKWLKIAPKPTQRAKPVKNSTQPKARNHGFKRTRTRPTGQNTSKEQWKQSFKTPESMKGKFTPTKPKIIKAEPSGAQSKDPDKIDYDNIPTSQAHGSRIHRRVHRSIDRYGKPIDE